MPGCDDRHRGHHRSRSTTQATPVSTTTATSPPPTAARTGRAGAGLVIAEGVVVVPPIDRLTVPRPVAARGASTARRAGGRPRRRSTCPPTPPTPTRWPPSSASTSTAACSPSPTGPRRPIRAALAAGARLLAVAEGVNDHENLGSLFRNAAALGVDGVLLGPRCADPLYRRSVRVSMGHVLRVPFADLPGEWPGSLDVLRAAGLRVAALTPGARRAAAGRGRSHRDAHRPAAGRGGPGADARGARGGRPARPHPDGRGRRLSQCRNGCRGGLPRGDTVRTLRPCCTSGGVLCCRNATPATSA